MQHPSSSLLGLEFVVPDSYEDAMTFLKSMEEKLGLEYSRSSVLNVKYDIRKGTYIREVVFNSTRSVTFTYNEGTEEQFELDPAGFIVAGEKRFDVLPSVRGTCSLELSSYYDFRNKLSEFSDFIDIPAVDIMTMIYSMLPKVRVDFADHLYHIRDSHLLATRSEVFDAYLKSALLDLLREIPDEPGLLVYLLDSTQKGCSLTLELLSVVNGARVYPIGFSASDGSFTAARPDYIYYLSNPFTQLSAFKSDLIARTDVRHLSFDDLIEVQLERNLGDSSLVGCSYIGLSYKPLACVTSGTDPIHRGKYIYEYFPESYDVGSVLVCPHKPWSLFCISKKDDKFFLPGILHTRQNIADHYSSFITHMIAVIYVNCVRNGALASSECYAEMHDDLYMQYLQLFSSYYHKTELKRRFDYPVRFKSKTLKTSPPSLSESVSMALAISKLKDDVWYTSDDLVKTGWTTDMISRAVRLNILLIGKDTSYYTYSKRSSTNNYLSFVPEVVRTEVGTVSILLPSGEVVSSSDLPDTVIALVPPVVVERRVLVNGGKTSNRIVNKRGRAKFREKKAPDKKGPRRGNRGSARGRIRKGGFSQRPPESAGGSKFSRGSPDTIPLPKVLSGSDTSLRDNG